MHASINEEGTGPVIITHKNAVHHGQLLVCVHSLGASPCKGNLSGHEVAAL